MFPDNKNLPLVSIIIPLYNAEKYIAETIRSALAQTWPNKEVIVIDDGSTDNSVFIAKQFETNGVIIITQKNSGASAARNRGLKEAKGTYIQFLDADDLLSDNKIAAQMKVLSDNPGYISVCSTVHFFDETDPYVKDIKHEWISAGTNDPADFLIKLYGGGLIGEGYGGMIQPNAWLCPAEILHKAGPWNEDLTVDDDGEYFCRVILAGKGIRYVSEAINYYRKFKNLRSLSAKKSFASCRSNLTATQLKTKYLLAATTDPNAKIAMSRVLSENAFNFYPFHLKLAHEAERDAMALNPALKYRAYKRGFKKNIELIVGWKPIKYLQYLKNK